MGTGYAPNRCSIGSLFSLLTIHPSIHRSYLITTRPSIPSIHPSITLLLEINLFDVSINNIVLHFRTLEDQGDEAEAVRALGVSDKRNFLSICRVVRIVQSLHALEWQLDLHRRKDCIFVACKELARCINHLKTR